MNPPLETAGASLAEFPARDARTGLFSAAKFVPEGMIFEGSCSKMAWITISFMYLVAVDIKDGGIPTCLVVRASSSSSSFDINNLDRTS